MAFCDTTSLGAKRISAEREAGWRGWSAFVRGGDGGGGLGGA